MSRICKPGEFGSHVVCIRASRDRTLDAVTVKFCFAMLNPPTTIEIVRGLLTVGFNPLVVSKSDT
eukprot:5678425-Amphidinium_carterae.1